MEGLKKCEAMKVDANVKNESGTAYTGRLIAGMRS